MEAGCLLNQYQVEAGFLFIVKEEGDDTGEQRWHTRDAAAVLQNDCGAARARERRLLLAGVMCVLERRNKCFENELEQELVSAAAARHGEALTMLGDAKARACWASMGRDLRVL